MRSSAAAIRALCVLLVLFGVGGCAARSSRSVVIWVSIDGMRHDYVDRFDLPLMHRMMREGAYTRQLAPVFPSLTFPSHASQITGVSVREHGITSNTFYDSGTKQTYKSPDDSSLIEAEPIWVTAARQHVRSAISDWPMSYAQQGQWRADYFQEKFDKDLTDAQRLERLFDVWQSDDPAQHGGEPLRLLIGYIPSIDSAGHKHGPDAPQMQGPLVTADMLLEGFVARAQRIFAQKMRHGDRLYFIFTTDHGMSPLREQFILEDILGERLCDSLHIAHSGNVANIYLDDPARADEVLNKLRAAPHVRAWKRSELPERWHYAHPTRTGDIVAALEVGYGWKSKPQPTTEPTTKPAEPSKGMHGYPVEEDPDMMGFAVIWSPQQNLSGTDLGKVDSLQLHPTVAMLLQIAPARGATAPAVEFTTHNVTNHKEAPTGQ